MQLKLSCFMFDDGRHLHLINILWQKKEIELISRFILISIIFHVLKESLKNSSLLNCKKNKNTFPKNNHKNRNGKNSHPFAYKSSKAQKYYPTSNGIHKLLFGVLFIFLFRCHISAECNFIDFFLQFFLPIGIWNNNNNRKVCAYKNV